MFKPGTYYGVQSPDAVILNDKDSGQRIISLYAVNNESYPFGYFLKKDTGESVFLLGERNGDHDEMLIANDYKIERDKFLGRVWRGPDIVAFYSHYGIPTGAEIKKVMEDLVNAFKEADIETPYWGDYIIVSYKNNDGKYSGLFKQTDFTDVICQKAVDYMRGGKQNDISDKTVQKKKNDSEIQRAMLKGKEDLSDWEKNSPYADKKYQFALTAEEIQRMVAECVRRIREGRMLNESKQGLKSQKLHDILKQYGGIRRYGHKAYLTGFGLSDIKDEDIVGVFPANEIPKSHKEIRQWVGRMGYDVMFGDYIDTIELNKTSEDGYILYLVVVFPNAVAKKYFSTVSNRESNRPNNDYRWKSTDAQHYMFRNPWFKDWDKQAQDAMRAKVRQDYGKSLNEMTETEVDEEAKNANTNPTDAQKHAGNYAKGHVRIKGFEISVENPRGTYRKGKDKNGKEWRQKMPHHYGYFTRTLGKDGDAIDVFIGKDYDFDTIYVVDQVKPNGEFDESKVMFCFKDEASAKKGYLDSYSKDWKGFKKITGVNLDFFKEWLYDGHRQRIPFYQYVDVKKNKIK